MGPWVQIPSRRIMIYLTHQPSSSSTVNMPAALITSVVSAQSEGINLGYAEKRR